jgi:hypothetical protein
MVQEDLKELIHLQQRVLPVKVGRAVRDSVRENFRKGRFYNGQSWKTPLRTSLGFSGAGGQYGPLLSGSDHLMMSTDYIPLPGQVIIRNPVEYASVHNDGDQISVTQRMKKFFWAKHYEAEELRGKGSVEADFWKNMALKKPGGRIKIPRRHFLGPGAAVDKIVNGVVDTELRKFVKQHSNGKTTARSD